ncbi:MAG TPA: 23S rRNA (adenine(2503)-C(2))-methyltransferase RlmN [Planctomycetaceae bacterium]|nr:23S rRNA (adenine(2503)-C(2))-methyltransferase RlmN [Planctomycetaceae bacterium]
MTSLCDLSRGELAQWCQAQGAEPYRADQIRKWIFGKRANDFALMTDLSAGLREKLAEAFVIFSSRVIDRQRSEDGTEKLLVEMADGEKVECVLMREDDRRTICVSTQVGCGMGCVFCASGMMGLARNLSAGEIIEQILLLDRLLGPLERITNVVVMGMGEPLANLPNLLQALATLDEKGGLGLGARRVTISTVGLPDKIRVLARVGKPYNLAVSLHAPNDRLRSELVPVNEKIGIGAILEAADEYFDLTGRRVTYEYVVLSGRNDDVALARELAALLNGRSAHLNLIPMNAVSELSFHDPGAKRLRDFSDALELGGVTTTIRKRKGADIDAACGQLRLRSELQSVVVSNPVI